MPSSGQKTSKENPISRTGTVIRSTGSRITVRSEQGEHFDCVVRGKFRLQGLKSTNPVAVGDQVVFTPGEKSDLGVITELKPRKNYILRRAVIHSNKVHILAANVDQAILVFTIRQPETSTGFADRFLVVAEAYHIPAIILINKVDLISGSEDRKRLTRILEIYQQAGYPVYQISALDSDHRPQAQQLLQDKITFIGGHSGSGKTTFINLVDPELNLRTGSVSEQTNKGRHTTTFAEMHELAGGGFIIDSPGIRELGMVYFEPEEIGPCFPEIRALMSDCRFSNCTHRREPGCAVRQAVEEDRFPDERYHSYVKLFEEAQEARKPGIG